MHTKQTLSFDEREISYSVSRADGPAVVLFNGFSARSSAWNHLIQYFGNEYRFVTWDYRPWDGPGVDGMQAHARDAAAVLAAEQIGESVWMGWSFGVQVMLTSLAQGLSATHLVMLNGTFGASSRIWLPPSIAPRLPAWLARFQPSVQSLTRRATRWPETPLWLKRLGLVGPTIDEQSLTDVVRGWGETDLAMWVHKLRVMQEHSTEHLLDSVRVPTLAILAERDPITPRRVAESLVRRIPTAEIFVVRGATHYAALEFPELINLRVEKFLREHGA